MDLLIINNLLAGVYNAAGKIAACGVAVWDRVDLILKIFQQHATTTHKPLQIASAAIATAGPRVFGMGNGDDGRRAASAARRPGRIEYRDDGHLFEQEQAIRRQLEKAASTRKVHRAGCRRPGSGPFRSWAIPMRGSLLLNA